jgi:hypothetical protein
VVKITEADDARGKAFLSLTTELQKYRAENWKHLSGLAANAKQVAGNIATLRVAKILLKRYPRIAFCGTSHLMGLAAAVRSHYEDVPDDLDLWGKTDIRASRCSHGPNRCFLNFRSVGHRRVFDLTNESAVAT